MEKIKRGLFWSVVASETIHIFCCVLPTIFSILSLMAGFGLIATMPSAINIAHETIHEYEIPMIITSAIILLFGWAVYIYSKHVHCEQEGTCCHGSCEPKKDRTQIFMIVATILFVVNVSIYFSFHRDDVSSIRAHVDYNEVHMGHKHD